MSNFLRNYGQLFGKSRETCGKPYLKAWNRLVRLSNQSTSNQDLVRLSNQLSTIECCVSCQLLPMTDQVEVDAYTKNRRERQRSDRAVQRETRLLKNAQDAFLSKRPRDISAVGPKRAGRVGRHSRLKKVLRRPQLGSEFLRRPQ